jgi:hypothetical protein
MIVNKDDYVQWKTSPVTEVYIQALTEEIQSVVASLVMSAGLSPTEDRYKAGQIRGMQHFLEWEPQFPEEENTDESESLRPQGSY